MSWSELLSMAVFAVFAEHFVLVQLLGVSPFLKGAEKMSTALAMGAAMTVVMALASLCAWAVNIYLLVPFGVDGCLQLLAFVAVIAVLSLGLKLLLQKVLPVLFAVLEDCLPLITVNCAVLGVMLLNARSAGSAVHAAAYGLLGGLGFALAMVVFASLRERLELADCPGAFKGLPLALVTAGLLAMALTGFSGLRLL